MMPIWANQLFSQGNKRKNIIKDSRHKYNLILQWDFRHYISKLIQAADFNLIS